MIDDDDPHWILGVISFVGIIWLAAVLLELLPALLHVPGSAW